MLPSASLQDQVSATWTRLVDWVHTHLPPAPFLTLPQSFSLPSHPSSSSSWWPSVALWATLVAGVMGGMYLTTTTVRRRRHAHHVHGQVKHLRSLFRTTLSHIKAAASDADVLISMQINPAIHQVQLFLQQLQRHQLVPTTDDLGLPMTPTPTPPPPVDPNLLSTPNQLARQLLLAQELVQRQLEALDNIKPNSALIEYTARYPLSQDQLHQHDVLMDQQQDDRYPHDILFEVIVTSFSPSDRTSLHHLFTKIKVSRKTAVQNLLAILEQVDAQAYRLQMVSAH